MSKESSEEKILDLLKTASMDYKQLRNGTGLLHATLFYYLNKLEVEKKVKKIEFIKGHGRAGRSPEYFGTLASKTYFFRPEPEYEYTVLSLLNQGIPPKDEMRRGVQNALTRILKRRLPESIYKKFYAARRKKTFKPSEDDKKILDLLLERGQLSSQEIAKETQIGNTFYVGNKLKNLRYRGYVERCFNGSIYGIIKWELIKNYKA